MEKTDYIVTEEMLQARPLSASSLKEFRKSPKHYIQYLKTRKEKTEAMLLGSLVDCLVLEPEKFDQKFLPWEKFERRSNDAKAKYADLMKMAADNHMTLVSSDLIDVAQTCKTALMDHDQARMIIEARQKVQARLKWIDKTTKLPMIGYIDFDAKVWDELFIVDLKTATSGDPDDFNRQAAKLEYHIQAGAYLEGYPRCYFKFPMMIFLVVETDEPFNVSVMFCDNNYSETAKDEFHGTLNAFRYCMDNQLFHQGYEFRLMGTTQYHSMNLPKYIQPKFITA